MIVDIYSRQIEGIISNEIFNSIYALGLKIPDPILQRVVSRVAEEVAVLVNGTITRQANQTITTLPRQRVGYNNPFNLTSGNLGASDFTNNLFGILKRQYSSQITNVIASKIENELALLLPEEFAGVISFRNLITTFSNLITPSIEKSISVAIGGFTTGLFNNSIGTPTFIPSVTNYFDSFNSDDALRRINEDYSRTVTDRTLGYSSRYDLNNQDNNNKLITLDKGFISPDANFPRKEYSDLVDVNKLATGDVFDTIVQRKNDSRMIGAKLPGLDSWDQPISPFKAKYPYNKVTETESGHIIEVDDTPGAERLHIYHKSGTFIEIDANGSIVKRSVGSSYEIIDKNGKIAIEGRADVSINGACNIFIGQDANIEVNGDTNITCHNDTTIEAGGKLNLTATEEINIASNRINIEAYDGMHIKSLTDLYLHSEETTYIKSDVDVKIESDDDIHIKANDSLYIDSDDNLYIKSNSDVRVESDSEIHIGSIESINIESINIHNRALNDIFINPIRNLNLRCGLEYRLDAIEYFTDDGKSEFADGAESSNNADSSIEAETANAGLLDGRIDIVRFDIDDPQFINIIDDYTFAVEEEATSQLEFDTHKDNLILSGLVTSEQFNAVPLEIMTDNVNSTQSIVVSGKQELKNYTSLPGNYNLSQNFTLEMLSSKAAVSKYVIQPSSELTYGEIVYNLQQLALNILEPIYAIYPKMIVTSGYRPRSNSTSTSQHPKGQAVDIQFKGISKSEYYDISVNLAKVLNYDQFLLEYSNYSRNPWIHISFVGINNRKAIATFWNNRKYKDGLYKLV